MGRYSSWTARARAAESAADSSSASRNWCAYGRLAVWMNRLSLCIPDSTLSASSMFPSDLLATHVAPAASNCMVDGDADERPHPKRRSANKANGHGVVFPQMANRLKPVPAEAI